MGQDTGSCLNGPGGRSEGVKGLRALGARVSGPGRALARDGGLFGRSGVCSFGQTDGRTEILRVLQEIIPFGAAAQKCVVSFRPSVQPPVRSSVCRKITKNDASINPYILQGGENVNK